MTRSTRRNSRGHVRLEHLPAGHLPGLRELLVAEGEVALKDERCPTLNLDGFAGLRLIGREKAAAH